MSTVNIRSDMLRVLLDGPNGESDYEIAAKLIDAGLADGKYVRNMTGSGPPVAGLLWRGMTIKGIEYADDLADFLHRRTWRYRLKTGLMALGSWFAGVASGVLIQWSLKLIS